MRLRAVERTGKPVVYFPTLVRTKLVTPSGGRVHPAGRSDSAFSAVSVCLTTFPDHEAGAFSKPKPFSFRVPAPEVSSQCVPSGV